MKYRVRSKDGELEFASFREVEVAWLNGLVEPGDEVLEEGATRWRKAENIPLLRSARRTSEQVWGGSQFILTAIGVLMASLALYLIAQPGVPSKVIGALLAFGVASITIWIVQRAHKRRKPHNL